MDVLIQLIIGVAAYVYVAYSLMIIANKTGTESSWMAWVPILNAYLMLKVAGKPGWWLLLFLVPVLNIVIYAIVWMRIAEVRGFPNWWGILAIVPFVNIIVPGYLAFSEGTHMTTGRPATHH